MNKPHAIYGIFFAQSRCSTTCLKAYLTLTKSVLKSCLPSNDTSYWCPTPEAPEIQFSQQLLWKLQKTSKKI
ncbi:hypothetical protein ACTXT7_006787 [Hymenolepis weldensis]